MVKKNVLILGGAGFIGLEIARYLGKNRDYNITIADISSSGVLDPYILVGPYLERVLDGAEEHHR